MAKIVIRNPITTIPVPEGSKCVRWTGTSYSGKCNRPAKVMAYARPVAKEPSPVCGVHAAGIRRTYNGAVARAESYARERAERDEETKRIAIADNLANFLTEQLGIPVRSLSNGRGVMLSIETAQAIYQAKAVLAENVRGTLEVWRP